MAFSAEKALYWIKPNLKGGVYSTSSHSQNERLRNTNMDGQTILFSEVLYTRKSQVEIWYTVATWVCEVTEILKPRSTKEPSFV